MPLNLRAGFVLALCLFAGCGGATKSRVHGKVTLAGRPIGPATVMFLASDNMVYRADLKPDGSYDCPDVARGKVRVCVQQAQPKIAPRPDPAPAGVSGGDVGKDAKRLADAPPSEVPAIANPLPAKYADANTSGLAFDLAKPDFEWSVDLE